MRENCLKEEALKLRLEEIEISERESEIEKTSNL